MRPETRVVQWKWQEILDVTNKGQKTLNGHQSVYFNRLMDLADPVEAGDAVNKQYVDNHIHITPSLARGTYNSIVYINGSDVVSENAAGVEIASGVSGTDDAIVLAAALALGGQIVVMPGTYVHSSIQLDIVTGTNLIGEGAIFQGIALRMNEVEHILVSGITFTGNPAYAPIYIYGESSNITIEKCIADSLGTAAADCFELLSKAAVKMEHINFIDCISKDCGRNGFILRGDYTNAGEINYVNFERCQALRCGKTSRANDYIVGFDICEEPIINHIRLTDCIAEECWESGFYQDSDCTIQNDIVYERCVSNNNANVKETPTFGKGFFVLGNTTLIGCVASGNTRGFGIEAGEFGDFSIIGCRVTSGYGGINLAQSGAAVVRARVVDCSIIADRGVSMYSVSPTDRKIVIADNYIEITAGNWGIYIANSNGCEIARNHIISTNNEGYGILVESGTGNKIFENTLDNLGLGIELDSAANVVVGNKVIATAWGQGIALNPGATGNILAFNVVPEFFGASISGNTILRNVGYVTEKSGSSTGTGSEQTIAHGLSFTPTRQQIILIAGSATANPYHSSAPDATNIYVTAGNGQAWYWNAP